MAAVTSLENAQLSSKKISDAPSNSLNWYWKYCTCKLWKIVILSLRREGLMIELDYETFPARTTKNKQDIITLWFLGEFQLEMLIYLTCTREKTFGFISVFNCTMQIFRQHTVFIECSLEVYNSQFKIAWGKSRNNFRLAVQRQLRFRNLFHRENLVKHFLTALVWEFASYEFKIHLLFTFLSKLQWSCWWYDSSCYKNSSLSYQDSGWIGTDCQQVKLNKFKVHSIIFTVCNSSILISTIQSSA